MYVVRKPEQSQRKERGRYEPKHCRKDRRGCHCILHLLSFNKKRRWSRAVGQGTADHHRSNHRAYAHYLSHSQMERS